MKKLLLMAAALISLQTTAMAQSQTVLLKCDFEEITYLQGKRNQAEKRSLLVSFKDGINDAVFDGKWSIPDMGYPRISIKPEAISMTVKNSKHDAFFHINRVTGEYYERFVTLDKENPWESSKRGTCALAKPKF